MVGIAHAGGKSLDTEALDLGYKDKNTTPGFARAVLGIYLDNRADLDRCLF
jgi:hypothetical protein